MVFTIDYPEARYGDNRPINLIASELLGIMDIEEDYGVNKAEFRKEKAKIEIKSSHLSKKIRIFQDQNQDQKKRLPLQLRSFKNEGDKSILNFELNKDHIIEFKTNEGVHSFLRDMGNVNLPEEVSVHLHYEKIPYGLWRALPKDVLNNLRYFEIKNTEKGTEISWPCEVQGGYSFASPKEDGKKLNVQCDTFFPKEEQNKRLKELTDALKDIRFIKYVYEEKNSFTKTEDFIFEGEMDIDKFIVLEDLLKSDNGMYNLETELMFNGEINREIVQDIAEAFNHYHGNSEINFPDFMIKAQQYNEGTIVTISNPGDLETAARISGLFDLNNTEISYKKS